MCRETVRVLYAAQASADRPRAPRVGHATGRALCLSAWHAARVQAVVRELMAQKAATAATAAKALRLLAAEVVAAGIVLTSEVEGAAGKVHHTLMITVDPKQTRQTHSVVPSFDFRYEARRAPSMSAAPLERLWALLATRMAAQAHQGHTVLWLGRLVSMSCMGCERWWRRSCTLLR